MDDLFNQIHDTLEDLMKKIGPSSHKGILQIIPLEDKILLKMRTADIPDSCQRVACTELNVPVTQMKQVVACCMRSLAPIAKIDEADEKIFSMKFIY